jgi:BolA family transcriptional regulator, general stress-responsive regulator
MLKAKIEQLLTGAFSPDFLEVIDESHKHIGHGAPGGHFRVNIVSARFRGKKSLEVHRMIYQALEPARSSIHALSIKARACAQE